MTVNPYISAELSQPEIDLLDELNIEAIQFAGIEFVYLRRDNEQTDKILDETLTIDYNQADTIEGYIENNGQYVPTDYAQIASGFTFAGTGYQIAFSKTRMNEVLGHGPRKGDLIYIPPLDAFHSIVDYDTTDRFHTAGGKYYWSVYLRPYKRTFDKFSQDYDGEMSELNNEQGVNALEKFTQNIDQVRSALDELDTDNDDQAKDTLDQLMPDFDTGKLDDAGEEMQLTRPTDFGDTI